MSIEDIFEYVITVAISVIIILLLTQRFLDITVIRQGADQDRATSNILQAIVTSSPLLMTDSGGNPERFIFKYGATNSNNQPLQSCCGLLEYDYKFRVGTLAPVLNFVVPSGSQNFIFGIGQQGSTAKPVSACYTYYGLGNVVEASTLVDVCDSNGVCVPTTATLTTADTPLSELAFWISAECQDQTNRNFEKQIPFDVNDVIQCQQGSSTPCGISIDNNAKQICINTQYAGEQGTYCKNFVCNRDVSLIGSTASEVQKQPLVILSPQSVVYQCFYAMVQKSGSSLSVLVPPEYVGTPGQMIQKQQTLPSDQDAWTEGTAYAYSSTSNCVSSPVSPVDDTKDVYYGLKSVLAPNVCFDTATLTPIFTLDLTKIRDNQGNPIGPIDLTNYNHIKFAFKASSDSINTQFTSVKFTTISATLLSGSQYCIIGTEQFDFGSWNIIDLPFSNVLGESGCPSNFPMNHVTGIRWDVTLLCTDIATGQSETCNVDLRLDNLYFYKGVV